MDLFNTKIILRHDDTINWLAHETTVLMRGEVGIEFLPNNSAKLKIGDGVTSWNNLPYFNNEVIGDKLSVDVINGVLQLVGFDTAETGAYLTKGEDGVATWVVPDNFEIEQLIDNINKIDLSLSALQTTIGKPATTDSESTGIFALLDTKANVSEFTTLHEIIGRVASTESPSTGIFALLDTKANISDVYTKDEVYNKNEIDALVGSVFHYRGSKKSYSDLPTEGQITGDVWNIETDDITQGIKAGDNVVWNGTTWDKLSSTVDLSNYVTNDVIEPIQATIDNITKEYLTKNTAKKLYKDVKYEFINLDKRILVDYREEEIRVMCPNDLEWNFQNVPSTKPNADPSNYYAQFRIYAPNDSVVGFKESMGTTITDNTLYTFDDKFAGIDEFGRKYSVCWLSLAYYDTNSEKWIYRGSTSTFTKYLGWTYSVEWYNANNERVSSSTIRINLSNENCHNRVEPFYMANVVKDVSEEFTFVKENGKLSINAIDQSKIKGLTEILNTKINAIKLADTEIPALDGIVNIPVASEAIAGIIKSAVDTVEGKAVPNAVYVDPETGIGKVKSVNVNSLVQDEDDVLILFGGNAD